MNKSLAVFHRSNGKTWIFYRNRGYSLNKAGGICVRNLSKKIFEERDFKTLQYVFDSLGVCISQRCIHSLGFRHMFAELEGKLFKDYKRHKCDSLLIEEHLSISLSSAAKISGWKIQIRETKRKTRKKQKQKQKPSISTLILRTCEEKNFLFQGLIIKSTYFAFLPMERSFVTLALPLSIGIIVHVLRI